MYMTTVIIEELCDLLTFKYLREKALPWLRPCVGHYRNMKIFLKALYLGSFNNYGWQIIIRECNMRSLICEMKGVPIEAKHSAYFTHLSTCLSISEPVPKSGQRNG